VNRSGSALPMVPEGSAAPQVARFLVRIVVTVSFLVLLGVAVVVALWAYDYAKDPPVPLTGHTTFAGFSGPLATGW